MSKGIRRIALAACCVALAACLAQQAGAFFPMGGVDSLGMLQYAVWGLKEFDTNNNGVVETDEGLEFRIEGGSSGFTPEEIEKVKAGFQVWADVPTAYTRFRFAGIVEDPIYPASSPDYLPTVYMQVTESAPGMTNITPDVAPTYIVDEIETSGLVALTLTLYSVTDVPVTSGNDTVTVPAGTIMDADIIVHDTFHRAGLYDLTNGSLDLTATIVNCAGTVLGMGYTALNNLDADSMDSLLPVESAVLQMTGTDGVPRMVGVTPSMLPEPFLTEGADGQQIYGQIDLAPDDISGISWLYPRKDGQDRFFSVSQEARTHTRRGSGIPSTPVSGAHIVAWANVTNNEGDRRVPLFSTMSGLYEMIQNENLSGHFDLLGLWKQLEVPGTPGDLFNTTYVLTMNPFNGGGVDKQAPPGADPYLLDSLQGTISYTIESTRRRSPDNHPFASNYPSEVFNEDGNIYGIENNAAGTPLVWDYTANTVVSNTTGKTIPTILPLNRPMFGDPNDVCPLNVLTSGGGSDTGGTVDTGNITVAGIKALRGFRDDVLLRSAPGAALVDAYYQVSPVVARFLLRHVFALKFGRALLAALEWIMVNWMVLLAALSGLGVVRWLVRRRRARAAIASLTVTVLLLAGSAAHGLEFFRSTADVLADATDVVAGKVVSAEGRWGKAGRIYTDVVIEVADTAKGTANKQANVTFSVIGGTADGYAMNATGIPSFKAGEEVVLYLQSVPGRGLVICGGQHGKQLVATDAETGEKYVTTFGTFGEATLKADKKAIDAKKAVKKTTDEAAAKAADAEAKAEEDANRIPLEDYMQYLRDLANEQARAAVK